ncbi:DUF3159 domain-containing protein [Gordonia terrae]
MTRVAERSRNQMFDTRGRSEGTTMDETTQKETRKKNDAADSRPKTTDAQQVLMDQLGGVSGMIYSAIPVVVFVAADAVATLPIAIGAAIAVAVLTAGIRLARGEPVVQASGGIIGVAAAGAVAAATGSADGYFLLGIWANGIEAVIVLATVLMRRPLTGMLWNLLHGNKYSWRQDRVVLRAHDIANSRPDRGPRVAIRCPAVVLRDACHRDARDREDRDGIPVVRRLHRCCGVGVPTVDSTTRRVTRGCQIQPSSRALRAAS